MFLSKCATFRKIRAKFSKPTMARIDITVVTVRSSARNRGPNGPPRGPQMTFPGPGKFHVLGVKMCFLSVFGAVRQKNHFGNMRRSAEGRVRSTPSVDRGVETALASFSQCFWHVCAKKNSHYLFLVVLVVSCVKW